MSNKKVFYTFDEGSLDGDEQVLSLKLSGIDKYFHYSGYELDAITAFVNQQVLSVLAELKSKEFTAHGGKRKDYKPIHVVTVSAIEEQERQFKV